MTTPKKKKSNQANQNLKKKLQKEIQETKDKIEASVKPTPARPVMDEEAFHGFPGKLCEIATKHSEADPVAILITFLVWFGVEVGKGVFHMIGDAKHFANIFATLVGRTAKARKGTSSYPIKRIIEIMEEETDWKICQETPGPLSSGEGLIYTVRDAVEEYDKKNKKHVIKDPGIDDKRLFIISEEMAGALIVMKREGNILSVVFRSFWDHGNAAPLTKANITKTTGAHVGIIAHITMEELKFQLSKTEIASGFANRFLWFFVQRQKLVPHPKKISRYKLKILANELFEILKFSQSVDEMKLNQSARDYWGQQYRDLSEDESGKIGVINNRSEAQAKRVAIIYALLDKSELITEAHLKSAIALVNYSRQSVRYIFDDEEKDENAEKIINALQLELPNGLTKTEISNNVFSRNLASKELTDALDNLALSGEIEKNKMASKSGKGKPSMVFKLAEKQKKTKGQPTK